MLSSVLLSQETLVLADGQRLYEVAHHISILEDPLKKLTITDVTSGSFSQKFQPNNQSKTNYGYTSAALWLKLTVKNTSVRNSDWLLSIGYPLIDKVELYTSNNSTGFPMMRAGASVPMKEWEINHRWIVFPISVKTGTEETLVLRMESERSINLPIRIWAPNALDEQDRATNLILGLFYGALLIMALFNLFLFVYLREINYLFYVLTCLGFCCYQACIDGFVKQYIAPNNVWLNLHVAGIAISSYALFGALFTRGFLQSYKYAPNLNKWYEGLIAALVLYIVSALFIKLEYTARLTVPFVYLYLFFSIVLGVVCLRKGSPTALLYLVATGGYFAASLGRGPRVLGLVENSFFSEYGMQIGILFEMTILAIALGKRIETLKMEKESEKALIRSRIASDLHDEIGSNLSSIVVASQRMQGLPDINESLQRRLGENADLAKKTAEMMRDIIWFVNPQHESTEDFFLKLKDTPSVFLQGIDYSFSLPPDACQIHLSSTQKRSLYLIFKEALHNILKHAYATRVEIILSVTREEVLLRVEDNGVGFDETLVEKGEGLSNLRKRAKEVCGQLEVVSSKGNGTMVTVRLPN